MNRKYIFNWSGKYPICIVEPSGYRQVKLYERFKIMAKKWTISYSINMNASCYSLDKDREALREVSKRYTNKKFAEKVFLESKKLRHEYWGFVDKLRKTDLEKISDQELSRLYSKLQDLLSNIFAFFDITRPEYQEYIEERLKQLVKKHFKEGKIINTLIAPTEPDEMNKEHNNLLLLCISNPKDKELLEFGYKNVWIFPEARNEKQLLEYLKERKEEIQKIGEKKVKRRTKEFEKEFEKRRKQQKKLFKKANDKELIYLSKLFQDLTIERVKQKKCWMDARYRIDQILSVVSKMKGVSKKDLIYVYQLKDIERLITQNKKLSEKTIEARKKSYAIIFNKGKVFFYEEKKAEKFIKPILEEQKKFTEIKGTPAQQGKAVGRIVFVPNSDLESLRRSVKKFRKGDILITQMTQPNMVVLAEKAAAIITDEGGIASHAAVISREFKIPCIVGTQNVTKLLKTGDYVEVDADKGIVRKINK